MTSDDCLFYNYYHDGNFIGVAVHVKDEIVPKNTPIRATNMLRTFEKLFKILKVQKEKTSVLIRSYD